MPVQIFVRKLEDKVDLNKKSQFYVLTVIILIAFAVGIASSGSRILKPQNVLFDLKKEFIQETPKVVNAAMLQKNYTTNVTGRYDYFVKDFIIYARTKNAKLDIVYVLSYENSSIIGNYYNEQININQNGISINISNNQVAILGRTNSINLTAGNYTYDFEIENNINVKGLMRKGSEILII